MVTAKLTPRRGLESQTEILLEPLRQSRMALERLRLAIARLPAGWNDREQFNVGLIEAVNHRADSLIDAADVLIRKLE